MRFPAIFKISIIKIIAHCALAVAKLAVHFAVVIANAQIAAAIAIFRTVAHASRANRSVFRKFIYAIVYVVLMAHHSPSGVMTTGMTR